MFDIDTKLMYDDVFGFPVVRESYKIWKNTNAALEKLLGRVDAPKPGFKLDAQIDLDGKNVFDADPYLLSGCITSFVEPEIMNQICSSHIEFKGNGISGFVRCTCNSVLFHILYKVSARTQYGGYTTVLYSDLSFRLHWQFTDASHVDAAQSVCNGIKRALNMAHTGPKMRKPKKPLPEPTRFSYSDPPRFGDCPSDTEFAVLGVVALHDRYVVGVKVESACNLVFEGIGPDDQPYFLVRMVIPSKSRWGHNSKCFYLVTDGETHYYPLNFITNNTKRLNIQSRLGSGDRRLTMADQRMIAKRILEWFEE